MMCDEGLDFREFFVLRGSLVSSHSVHEENTQLLLCLTKQFYDLTSLLATSEITADLPRFANVI